MAAAPQFKIFDSQGEYMGACKELEGASALVSFYGEGATIRNGHPKKTTVWTEGADGRASESTTSQAKLLSAACANKRRTMQRIAKKNIKSAIPVWPGRSYGARFFVCLHARPCLY
jgi:hypothetical protein